MKKVYATPKVSVCMIAYKVEKYIGKAIEGVLDQEADFEIELVISNDNSPDDTEKVVQYYIQNHSRGFWIKYFRQSSNLGMMGNYMWTFEKCRGKYLSICDSDDYWTDPKKLQKQVDFLDQNHEFVLSFHNSFRVDSKENVLKKSIEPYLKRDLNFQDLTKKGFSIPTASVVFRNDLGLKYPKQYLSGKNHDTFLYILLAQYGNLHYQDEILPSAYRIHSIGTWSSLSKMEKSLQSLETYINVQKVFPEEKGFERMVFDIRNNVLVYSLKEREYKTFFTQYPKNLIMALSSWEYFKLFFSLHKKVMK